MEGAASVVVVVGAAVVVVGRCVVVVVAFRVVVVSTNASSDWPPFELAGFVSSMLASGAITATSTTNAAAI
ncbi:MAG: hypothetical protein ACOYXM_02970 [Actinomycetota bacterium]